MEPACWSWPAPGEDLARQALYARTMPAARSVLMAWQEGMCAVCGTAFGESMVVDHDHLSQLIRGLLCTSCNIREGRRDAYGVFAQYRHKHPASILRLSVVYRSGMPVSRSSQPDSQFPEQKMAEVTDAMAADLAVAMAARPPAVPVLRRVRPEKRREGLIEGVAPRAPARSYEWTPEGGAQVPWAEPYDPWEDPPELREREQPVLDLVTLEPAAEPDIPWGDVPALPAAAGIDAEPWVQPVLDLATLNRLLEPDWRSGQ